MLFQINDQNSMFFFAACFMAALCGLLIAGRLRSNTAAGWLFLLYALAFSLAAAFVVFYQKFSYVETGPQRW